MTRVKKVTGLKHVRLALASGKTMSDSIQTVALCAGSGGSVLKHVANADLFLTGLRFHYIIHSKLL